MRETRSQIVRRRLRTVPTFLMVFAVLTAILPALIAIGLVVDMARWVATRKPFMSVRMILFAWLYMLVGLLGITALTISWFLSGFGRNEGRMIKQAYAAQSVWVRGALGSAKLIFSLRFEVEGRDVATPGPVLVFARHASVIDTLLPAWFIVGPLGIKLRYVLKKELLVDPVLDIGGLRLVNFFLDRESTNPREDLRAMTELATDLPEDEGVLIFPEGTRFTEERRRQALESIPDDAARAKTAQLRHVLAPRAGGAVSLLGAAPETDVIVFAHHGREGLAKVRDVWHGGMVRRTIRVKMWRVAADTLPGNRRARSEWLFDEWLKLDRWLASQIEKDTAAGD